jgi:hypothetical protein
MKKSFTVGVVTTAALASAVTLVSLQSTGAAASTGRAEHFRLYSANLHDHDLTMVFSGHGPIRGVGVARADDDAPGDTVPITVTLPGGKVFLKAHGDFTWHPNLKTCTATEHDRGTFRVTGGTGKYAHAHGSGRYDEQGAAIGQRSAAGVCQQSFKINYVTVSASGRVHL